jgi:hypothetical protein
MLLHTGEEAGRDLAGLDLGILPGVETHFANFCLFWTLISL